MTKIKTEDKLIEIAESHYFIKGTSRNIAQNPKWECTGRVHDWRNYIIPELRNIWDSLPIEAQIVAIIIAEQQADCEEWE